MGLGLTSSEEAGETHLADHIPVYVHIGRGGAGGGEGGRRRCSEEAGETHFTGSIHVHA